MRRLLDWLLVLAGIAGLVAVRFFEDQLFYDPFLQYFHEADKHGKFPQFEWLPLILSHLFRFVLNLVFSLVIVHFLFRNKRWTVQAALLIALVFAIAFPIYLYCLHTEFSIGNLFSFYVRRFVIQPIAILLIVPMFYYRREMQKRNLA